ncbi:hypothetical protein ACP4OV_010049 [Aristida adscensionis]
MPWFPAAPPALAAADGGRIIKKRAGLPKLLHKLFIKVLRLRPSPAAEAPPGAAAAFGAYYGYRMDADEEYCYYYSYGGGGSSWAGVLSSIPEEEVDSSDDSDEGTPDAAAPAVLRKAKSERFVIGHVDVLL